MTVSVPPSALELALLQHAQQLHLRAEVDVADLVEKQRAAVGQLEAALLPRLRAGERALLVAEQLGLDQALGQRRAAHLDERLLGAQRVVVDRVRDELLAGARLAADQHRRVRLGDLRDLLVHLAHRSARADDVREVVALAQLLPQVRVLVEQPPRAPPRPARWILSACAIIDATTPRNFTLLSKSRSALNRRSTPSAPTALRFSRIGTQTKLSSCRASSPLRAARLRNAGSRLTRGTTTGLPLSTTRPVMPSPTRYRTVCGGCVEAVGRLDGQLAVLAEQRHHAAHRAVVLAQDLEHAVER